MKSRLFTATFTPNEDGLATTTDLGFVLTKVRWPCGGVLSAVYWCCLNVSPCGVCWASVCLDCVLVLLGSVMALSSESMPPTNNSKVKLINAQSDESKMNAHSTNSFFLKVLLHMISDRISFTSQHAEASSFYQHAYSLRLHIPTGYKITNPLPTNWCRRWIQPQTGKLEWQFAYKLWRAVLGWRERWLFSDSAR